MKLRHITTHNYINIGMILLSLLFAASIATATEGVNTNRALKYTKHVNKKEKGRTTKTPKASKGNKKSKKLDKIVKSQKTDQVPIKPNNICRKPKAKCENLGKSYICGDLECEYKNKCLAESAGYDLSDLSDDCNAVKTDERSNDIGYIKNSKFKSVKTKVQPLSAKLSTFGPKSARSYDSCFDFENDLKNAATIIVNEVIQRNSQYGYYYYDHYAPFMVFDKVDSSPENKVDSSPDNSGNGNDKESSYGTNNQVDGVDEADIVKATTDIVFAGYGNKLVVFNVKTGEKMSETIMSLKSSEIGNEFKTTKVKGLLHEDRLVVKVKGLLLHEDRLAVIVTSRRNRGRGRYGPDDGEKSKQKLITSYGTDTFVYLYDVSESELPNDGSEMKLLASHTIEGHDFNTARSIGNTTHLVTMSSVNINSFLENPLSRWRKRFSGFDNDEYVRKTLIRNFQISKTLIGEKLSRNKLIALLMYSKTKRRIRYKSEMSKEVTGK